MLQIFEGSEFKTLPGIGHAFFTRKGGVSEGHLSSLNCSTSCGDNPAYVLENQQRALNFLQCQQKLITVNNVHGNHVAIITDDSILYSQLNADAMVTDLDTVVLASDSADCPIILFADPVRRVIGLAHAGWRGAKQNIIEETVKKMVLLGAQQHQIHAVISPCIAQESYEVSLSFYHQFLTLSKRNHVYFKESINTDHIMFDLLGFVKDKLRRLFLKSVTAIGLDTYANEDLFFSCRRAFHRNEACFGGHWSCIYLK